MEQRKIEHTIVDIDSVQTHPKNVRQGDIGAISESLKAHGQYRPIVVDRRTNRILAGNHTWKAAKALGWQQIAAGYVETKDDDEALRILLADNRTTDLASYDDSGLAELLKQLSDTDIGLEGTAFDGDDLDALLKDLGHFELPTDVDEIPEDVPAISKLGDVWLCGEHRVVCGDSTDEKQVAILMQGKEADLVWTDPPYGVNIQERDMAQADVRGRRKDGKGVMNDDLKGNALSSFLHKAFTIGKEHTKAGGCWYVASPPGDLMMQFGNALLDLGLARHSLVWVKDTLVMGRADYHYRHEVLFYGWKEGAAHQPPPDRKQDSVWEVTRPKRSPEHPTMKPVELIMRAIQNSTNEKQIVLDLFGGSGSTLIAAQETNRIAYSIELDPQYVDVICARYQKHTGNQPILEATGEPHNFL
jgi:site-specific DNA-methyltransferase (adenine-specific)